MKTALKYGILLDLFLTLEEDKMAAGMRGSPGTQAHGFSFPFVSASRTWTFFTVFFIGSGGGSGLRASRGRGFCTRSF